MPKAIFSGLELKEPGQKGKELPDWGLFSI